jgi:hypothetical protein
MRKYSERRKETLLEAEKILVLNWSSWYALTEESIKLHVPKRFGIYKIRQTGGVLVSRLVGQSEILYIGRSGTSTNRTLGHRLLELVREGPHVAWPRVRRLREQLGLNLEFCYAESDEPEETEKVLLMVYEKEHYELPPLNHVGGL